MKKVLVTIGILLLLVVLVGGGAIAFIVNKIDPNTYKPKISQVVYDNTGRELSLNGPISWSFFPWLGITIKDATLSNSAYFKDKPFASVGEIHVTVRLLPLLFDKLEIGKIALRDFNLNLIKNTAGETNWKDLFSHSNDTGDKTATTLLVNDIDITNANITLQNEQTNKTIAISNFNFSGSNINFSHPFPIKTDFSFSVPALSGHLRLDSIVTAKAAEQIYALEQTRLSGDIQGQDAAAKLDFVLNTEATANLNKQTFELSDFSIKTPALTIEGKVHGTSIIDAPTFAGNLSIASSNPDSLLKILGYSCNKKLGICKSLSANLQVETTSKFLKVPKLAIKIDDTVINGTGSYSHFDEKNIVFNLDINQFDVDRYLDGIMPIGKPAVKTTSRTAAHNRNTYTALKDFRFNGDLSIGNLKLAKIRTTDLHVQVNSDNIGTNLDPITFKLYRGTAQSSLALNFKKNAPAYRLKTTLSGIDLQPLFADVAGEGLLGGTASFNADVTSYGDSIASILRSLNGAGKLAIANGGIQGIDIKYQIDRANALLNRNSLPRETVPARTAFDQVTATFTIKNGVLNNNDLLTTASYFKLTGNGSANLATQILDYQLQAYGMHNGRLTNFYVPVKITGSFMQPKIQPDVAVIAQEIIKDAVTKQIKNVMPNHLIKSLNIGKELNKVFR